MAIRPIDSEKLFHRSNYLAEPKFASTCSNKATIDTPASDDTLTIFWTSKNNVRYLASGVPELLIGVEYLCERLHQGNHDKLVEDIDAMAEKFQFRASKRYVNLMLQDAFEQVIKG